jgi:GxxExxY protein
MVFSPERAVPVLQAEVEVLVTGIMDAAFRVHRRLGPFYRESVYQRCMARAMEVDGIPFGEKPGYDIEFEGITLDRACIPDFVVANTVVVDLKVAGGLTDAHSAQMYGYLRQTGLPLGLLFDFNHALLKDGFARKLHPDLIPRNLDEQTDVAPSSVAASSSRREAEDEGEKGKAPTRPS